MTIDKEARSTADFALLVANKAKKGIKDRQVKNISVASQSAMLALTDVSPGQIVIREDDGYYNYLLKALPASSLANWQPMGKDASPVGETVSDIIITNENLGAKPDGLYAIAGVPLGGLPSGVALGDIVQKTEVVYTIAYTFSTAPATIYSNSDQKTYNKKTNGAGNPTWETTPIPTTYPCGVGFKYITLQAAIDAYTADFLAGVATLGIIDLWDSIYNENVTIPSTLQNIHIRGIGTKYRSNTIVSRINALSHRVTLQNILLTNNAQTPLVINSSGTVTESGVPNVAKGKHVLDQVTFSTNQTNAIDVQSCDNFLIFSNCDFDSKVINIGNKTGTATSITIDGCNNGILNLGNNRVATKNNSLSVYRGTISSTGTIIIDVDAAKPIAYSILRSYSALGATIPVALGTLIINDDVGSTLQTLKCTTAYTIPVTINTGTPIDLTKYQVETDNLKQNTIPDGDNINEPRSIIASATTTNLNTATSDVINITGTTAITSFTLTNGVKKILVFSSALTLTYNATSLILPTSANITTSAGDSCLVIGTANGVQIALYQKADGTPLNKGVGTVPIGIIVAFYGATIPDGWLLCDGTAFNNTIYPGLHTFLGTTTLPDLRGVFLRGAGITTANGMIDGTNYNATTVRAFQGDMFKSHTHAHSYPLYGTDGANPALTNSNYANQPTNNYTTAATGGTETRPKSIGVNFIIKAN